MRPWKELPPLVAEKLLSVSTTRCLRSSSPFFALCSDLSNTKQHDTQSDSESEDDESGKNTSRKDSDDGDSDAYAGTTVISSQTIQAEKEKQFVPPYMQKKPAGEV